MDKNREEARKDLQKKVEKLPIKAQQAIAWSLNHWNLVRWMCEKNDTTNKEIEKMKVTKFENSSDNSYIEIYYIFAIPLIGMLVYEFINYKRKL